MDFDSMMNNVGDYAPSLKWNAVAGEFSIRSATGWEEIPLPHKFTLDLASARFGYREWVQTPDGSRPQDQSVPIGEKLVALKGAEAKEAIFLMAYSEEWIPGVEGLAEWVPASTTAIKAFQPLISRFRELDPNEAQSRAMEVALVGKIKVGSRDHRAPEFKYKIVKRPDVFLSQPPNTPSAAVGSGNGAEPSPASGAASNQTAATDEWSDFEAA